MSRNWPLKEGKHALASSGVLADRYRQVLGVESTAPPLPLEMHDAIAAERQPIFVTMIDPSPEKGLMVFARIAEEVSRRRPQVALPVIESRGSAGRLAGAALADGFDLRRHENILVSSAVPPPKDICAGTRVAAEALVNGIPPIVGDRGGLAEIANGGGLVAPIPPEFTPKTAAPVVAEIVEPWVDPILKSTADDGFRRAASRRALEAGRIYHRETLAPRYLEFFERAAG